MLCYFGMSHGSYDLNLSSKRLILARDIRSRSWPNIGGTYGMYFLSTVHNGGLRRHLTLGLYLFFVANMLKKYFSALFTENSINA